MKKFSILLSLVFVSALSSCDYQKNNTIKQIDLNEGNPEVYGVHPDSAARQLKNKYAAKPELEKRTDAIREKMFGSGKINAGA
jgi:hypothetical protein